jgi:membrane protein DedA with SNARE-associated domain
VSVAGFDLSGAFIFSAVTAGLGYLVGFEAVVRADAVSVQLGKLRGWIVAGLLAGGTAWWRAVRLRGPRCCPHPD